MLNSSLPDQPGSRTAVPPPRPAIRPRAAIPAQPYGFAPVRAMTQDGADAGTQGGFEKLAFRAGLLMLFIRFTALPELLVYLIHVNTFLLYFVGPPAILGAFVTGGVPRTLRSGAAWLWTGFLCCMLLALPFSTWVGGSAQLVKNYVLFSFPLLFVVGGLTAKWKDVRTLFTTIGIAGVFIIISTGLLAKPDIEGRITMTDVASTIGNSNDLASLLLLVLPFILFIAMDKRRARFIRYSLIAPIGYALKMILATASRGALLAMFAMFLFVLFRASARQKMIALAGAVVVAAFVPFVVSGSALERLATLLGGPVEVGSVGAEALESQSERRYVLEQSLLATLKHPVLGVGPGQFSNYVGELGKSEGRTGAALHWTETHNCFTEVSSECGVPALICFVLAIAVAFGSVSKTYRRARREGYTDIANTCFCYLEALLGFVVTITFLANAYRFYLPAMIGLAICVTAAAEQEMSRGEAGQPAGVPGWGGLTPTPLPVVRRRPELAGN